MISIVLLLSCPKELTVDDLRRRFAAAVGRPLGGSPADGDFVARFRPNLYPVRVGRDDFGVINVADRYVKEPPPDLDQYDARLRLAIVNHVAWTSVDMSDATAERHKAAAYPVLGRLAAELVDDTCLAVFATETQRMMWPYDGLRQRLAGGDPLGAIAEATVPVVRVPAGDPEMAAAVAEARRRWPEFATAFAARRPGQGFAVKVAVRKGAVTEYIWVNVDLVGDADVVGRLANHPQRLAGLKLGSQVRVGLDQLNDWMYEDGQTQHGGFTVEVLRRREPS